MLVSVLFLFGVAIEGAYGKAPSKIIKGGEATQGEFPYQVSLKNVDKHICGGAIISNRHILTAAHCIAAEHRFSDMIVVTGTNSLELGAGGQFHRVQNFVIHPEFVQQSQTNAGEHDIAVISLRNEIVENDLQRRIALPTKDISHGVTAIVSGFGRTGPNEKLSKVLKKALILLLSAQECLEKGTRKLRTNICGFSPSSGGTCKGDSGGPLVYNNEIIGVSATAGPCGFPEVYTKVYSHLDFIHSAMSTI